MFQVRIHGRGGQGVVTAAELLSMAAFHEGAFAQAFPSFGSERTGAPVAAYCRIDEHPIRTREPVVAPDAVIIQDSTLLRQGDVLAGLCPGGFLLVNSLRRASEIGLRGSGSGGDPTAGGGGVRMVTLPATDLALHHIGRPVPNLVLLGGFAALTGRVRLDSVAAAIRGRFAGALAENNVAAAQEAYRLVRAQLEERTDA